MSKYKNINVKTDFLVFTIGLQIVLKLYAERQIDCFCVNNAYKKRFSRIGSENSVEKFIFQFGSN